MAGRRISRDETAELAGAGPPLPPVHAAIMNNDVSTLASLIKSGSAQLHPENLETPLHTAARTGTMECLKWLLENHVKSPLDRARNRSTPAHYATVYGRLDALKVRYRLIIVSAHAHSPPCDVFALNYETNDQMILVRFPFTNFILRKNDIIFIHLIPKSISMSCSVLLPQLLVTHDKQKSKEITEQIDENGLSILSLATLQGQASLTCPPLIVYVSTHCR